MRNDREMLMDPDANRKKNQKQRSFECIKKVWKCHQLFGNGNYMSFFSKRKNSMLFELQHVMYFLCKVKYDKQMTRNNIAIYNDNRTAGLIHVHR